MWKKVLLFAMAALTTIGMVGCVSNPDEVTLATEQQVARYVKREYGDATVFSKETGSNSVTYLLKDDEYGFEYSVTSAATAMWADGVDGYVEETVSSFYKETKTDNFEAEYRRYFEDTHGEDIKAVSARFSAHGGSFSIIGVCRIGGRIFLGRGFSTLLQSVPPPL